MSENTTARAPRASADSSAASELAAPAPDAVSASSPKASRATSTANSTLSLRRIIGFACNQGFTFFLFYMGINRALEFGAFSFERAEMCVILLFMVTGFGVLSFGSLRLRTMLLTSPCPGIYAGMSVAGACFLASVEYDSARWLFAEGLLVGLPCALLIAAWGREFGKTTTKIAVPEVFVGTAIGALVGLIVSLVPIDGHLMFLRLLPIGSAIALMMPLQDGGMKEMLRFETGPAAETDDDTTILSAKVTAGTMLFGVAAGFMETFNTEPGSAAFASYPISLLLFGAFAIGTLSLLRSDGFGRGAALNKAYRAALFLMMAGYLLVPAPSFAESLIPGEAIVLSGYLGLSFVLLSLFLELAQLNGIDAARAFSSGFMALFGGELLGIALANGLVFLRPGTTTSYSVVVLAGLLVLLSYMFLFTERDFASLSEIVTSTDTFEEACEAIALEAKLSARESEILPYALKGRTSDRIAGELHISRSTVDTHLRRIYSKTGVHSRQELIDLAEQRRR